jgi:DNA-binding NtrC family response regulator
MNAPSVHPVVPLTANSGCAIDDRTPYEVAESVVRVIAALSPDGRTEESIWQTIFDGMGDAQRQYIQAIRQTRHSIFYHQMQQLYEFGIREAPSIGRAEFCTAVGRDYTEHALKELIPSLLQVAVARTGGFQAAVFEMVRMHLGRHAGNIYASSVEFDRDSLRLAISYSRPEVTSAYLQQHNLDPCQCFANSFHFIAGAAHEFARQIVQDYGSREMNGGLNGTSGWVVLPIGERDHFAFDRFISTLMGYLRELEAGRMSASMETELECSFVTRSRLMQDTWNRIRRASLSDELVLLRGESGTGKSFVARRIHELSRRRDKPFVEIGLTSDLGTDNLVQSNLFGHEKAAFTGATEQKIGLFTLADGGTIFLDEIGDATPELQAKLLRVTEEQTFKRLGGVRDIRVDVRIIAATNHDLEELARCHRFRQDLLYRLDVISIVLPPLRSRPEDIPSLAQFLLSRICRRAPHRRLPPELATALTSYPWPGNIRELEHALKHAVAMGDGPEILAADFPPAVRAHLGAGASGACINSETHSHDSRGVIDEQSLRRAIRRTDPVALSCSHHPEQDFATLAHARRVYLATLIDELNGDLSLIRLFWDRCSEKTLRRLVRDEGLADRLAQARSRVSRRSH